MKIYELEIFVNKENDIAIKQLDFYGADYNLIVVNPEQVPSLIKCLNNLVSEIKEK